VRLDGGEEITASVSAKARQVTVKLLPGDGVTVEISPYDPTRGRIRERQT
jgi:translation initiation factor IF-1